MRISRKLTAASVAAVAALAIAACSPPNENDSEIGKVPTAETQNPDSLNNGQPGFEDPEATTAQSTTSANATATEEADANGTELNQAPETATDGSGLEMGGQEVVTEQF
ncbi:hypothetical protein [Corynebacterium lubricantis]|uniref:hypothetical protein n=1 Tax=Corynebacterium lubricantis TaxID=541095 RepID=UPI00036F60D5|nr:hypothetical protein [Corynebacterium lubricantis]